MKHKYKNNNHKNKHMEEITGYYIDLPEGAQKIDGVEFVNYDPSNLVEYSPEDAQYFGQLVWDASEVMDTVKIDGADLPVSPVLNGAHPDRKPK